MHDLLLSAYIIAKAITLDFPNADIQLVHQSGDSSINYCDCTNE